MQDDKEGEVREEQLNNLPLSSTPYLTPEAPPNPSQIIRPNLTDNNLSQQLGPEVITETNQNTVLSNQTTKPQEQVVIAPPLDSQSTPVIPIQTPGLSEEPNLNLGFFNRLKNINKKTKIALSVLLLLIILGGSFAYVISHSKSPNKKPAVAVLGSFKSRLENFRLASTVPIKNATNVNIASKVTLNFSQPVAANKLVNNVFITPTVNGVFKQGDNPKQVVFEPSQPLTKGVKYSVMINGTVQSIQGTQLGIPEEYSFTTSIPNNQVAFQDQNGLIDKVTSLPSNQKESFSLYFGANVGPSVSVSLYKGSVNNMLQSLIHKNNPSNGFTISEFSDPAVSTSGLTKVSSTANLKNQSSYIVQQPDGLYVAVATNSSGKEVGFVWIDFSNLGVLLRQDDQKTILDAQNLANNQSVPASAVFYNLNGSVNNIGHQTINGLTTVGLGYSNNLDVVVATYNNETAIVPVNILDSGGDIRVDQNLSTAQAVYGITNKPTYMVGGTIKYAGYVRLDNDAQYVVPGSGQVKLYVGTSKGNALTSFSAPISNSGMFSGSFPVSGSWLTKGGNFNQLQLFASSVSGNSVNDLSVASFSITKQTNQSNNITVKFSQASYLPNNQISATINATNSTGSPLSNQTLQVKVYSEDYYENNIAANQANFGYQGSQLTNLPSTIKLNSNGQAQYTIKASTLPNDGNSQKVTIEANLPNQTGVGAAGGASTIVHQGNEYITFGSTRNMIPAGSNLNANVYINNLDGTPVTSGSINYELTNANNSQQLASGSSPIDGNGLATITLPPSELTSAGNSMELSVNTKDQYGNVIVSNSYYAQANNLLNNFDTSGASLLNLNVSGTSGNVNVGDSVNLNISSPAVINAMVTMDRGRIYKASMISLIKGDNNYSFNVTKELAPSFTLTFNYFLNGVYHSEGVAFNVTNGSNLSKLSINVPSVVPTGKQAIVSITSTDNSGNPLPTGMIVDIVSSNSYDMISQVNPDIYSTFYQTRPIMTSSSSSLSPIGSGGGRCGGGGYPLPSFADAVGSTLYWNPSLITNSQGQTTFNITPPTKGSWTITAYAMNGNTQVASRADTFKSN